ncbi:hypothetical protein JOC75_001050 [Metabacillus crassostreae]|uniref:hypothetical protein n=1 Tax=Metabacillus crassostreae TaxID=929098 RepID=UPI001959D8A7|nr:hypothetical protein [Metabacillus crassostreae]MBM7603080.1 hypothetical protein [Metabacillus crassostreae]
MFNGQMEKESVLVCVPDQNMLLGLEGYLNPTHSIVVTPNTQVADLLKNQGFKNIFSFSSNDTYIPLPAQFEKVVLIESKHIADTFDSLMVLRNSTIAPIIVVTATHAYPMRLYYSMGAKLVIYSRSKNISNFI